MITLQATIKLYRRHEKGLVKLGEEYNKHLRIKGKYGKNYLKI